MDESQFDLAALEEIDPSLEGGFKIQFDREIPIETRYLLKDIDIKVIGCKYRSIRNWDFRKYQSKNIGASKHYQL